MRAKRNSALFGKSTPEQMRLRTYTGVLALGGFRKLDVEDDALNGDDFALNVVLEAQRIAEELIVSRCILQGDKTPCYPIS